MSRAANDLEFFPRRRSGFKDAGFTVEQFSQVITGDCFVDSKHTSHLFLMLDFDPQSPDHTSVTFDRAAFVRRPQKFVKAPKQFFPGSRRPSAAMVRGSHRLFGPGVSIA